ncbi:hypothetical protein [Streptomyces sp. URMC 123]|uniref:hypothetical protein n=1 Tax=Streptomyces sp. URMC 123 TaxID=3423403 RepID=UPI003F1ACFB1
MERSNGGDAVEVWDTAEDRVLTPAPPVRERLLRAREVSTTQAVFTADNRHLAILHGRDLTVIAVPDMTLEHEIAIPAPGGAGAVRGGSLTAAERRLLPKGAVSDGLCP